MTAISITTVLYNNQVEAVQKLVKNILMATKGFEQVDYYLVNNSIDNKVLTNYLNGLDRKHSVHVITPSENKGFGAGNNLVIPILRSDYHLLVNPDVFVKSSNEIINMVHFMDTHKEYGLLSPLIKFPNGEVQHLLKRESTVLDMVLRFTGLPFFSKRKERFVNLPDGYRSLHEASNVPGSFMLFRTNIFRDIRGFDERYFLYMEDSDITKKVNAVSKTIFYPNACVYHEWQRENKKSVHGVVQMMSSTIKYFNKWGWKFL